MPDVTVVDTERVVAEVMCRLGVCMRALEISFATLVVDNTSDSAEHIFIRPRLRPGVPLAEVHVLTSQGAPYDLQWCIGEKYRAVIDADLRRTALRLGLPLIARMDTAQNKRATYMDRPFLVPVTSFYESRRISSQNILCNHPMRCLFVGNR